MNFIYLVFFIFILIKSIKCDILVYPQGTGQVIEEFRDLPAKFGPSIPNGGMRLWAVEGDPIYGCKPMAPPPVVNTTLIQPRWVVLIARYNCSFEDKIRNAQTAGWDAVIVFNVDSNDLESMSAKDDTGIVIPSVFVGERTAQIIKYNYQWEEDFALFINDDLPFNINTHLIVPFTIVVGLCFIVMIGFMIVKCVREQRRLRRHRLPNSVLKKIPIKKFAKGDIYETCAICLDDYIENEKLRVLPCNHAYHAKCIDPWLTKNRRVCPICKRKVFARGEPRPPRRRSSSDSSDSDDVDDTTPLINPVVHSPSNNHGTFTSNDPQVEIDVDRLGLGTIRATQRTNPFDRVRSDVAFEQPNRWERFKRYFQRRSSNSDDQLLPNDTEDEQEQQSQFPSTIIDVSTTPRRSASNNVLNKNLCGSFNDDAANDTSDDEMLTAPGSSSASAGGRLGVAALPNVNFNPTSGRFNIA